VSLGSLTVEGKGRRAEYAETTRAAIVEAAVTRFSADGFAGASIDSIAETARVTKGAVYHHFPDKVTLFEAAFISLEDRLVRLVSSGVSRLSSAQEMLAVGVDLYLAECCDDRFRRIALQEAPAVLGWARWKELEEARFLALVSSLLLALAEPAGVGTRDLDLEARMVLVAMGEAGLAVASSPDPDVERVRAGALVRRLVLSLA
jgi:AcrR family transcriptional regulator